MKFILILWLTTVGDSISVTTAEFSNLSACAAAGAKVLEKAPQTIPSTPNVRWVCVSNDGS